MQPNERKIVDLALAQGVLTPDQAQQLIAQRSAQAASGQAAPLRELLSRVMTPAQLQALEAAYQGQPPPPQAQAFLAANPGFVDQPTAVHDGVEEARLVSPGQALPDRLGPYVLERELARGGMGAVFVANHVELGRRVALKIMLNAGPTRLKRFQIEARVTAQLRHPNIVAIHEVGEQHGLHYFVMDLIEGESLAERLAREGPLEPSEAARIAEQLADALFYAHSHAILHRDLKPANVLLDERGQALITDFGLAKQEASEEESLTKTGQRVGTPAYMAPEQARGDKDWIDRRTDVYALGLVLYKMLTGELPYEADAAVNFMVAILYHPPTPPSRHRPGLDHDLETICLKCLEKDSTKRYSGAGELAEDLRRWQAGEPISARRAGWIRRGWRAMRRRPSAAAVALTLTVLALVALALGWQWRAAEALRSAREQEEQGLAAVAELRRSGWTGAEAESARARLRDAVALDPTLQRAWVQLARLALEAGEEAEAERCLDRARALAPLEGEAGYLRGRLDEAAGRTEAAERSYRAAWDGGYRPPEISARLARVQALVHAAAGRSVAAEEAWWAVLRQRPADPEPLAGVVRSLLSASDAVGLVRGWREVFRRLARVGGPGLQQLILADYDAVQGALERPEAEARERLRAALAAAYFPRPQTLQTLDALASAEAPSSLREAARATVISLARPVPDGSAPRDFAAWCRATGPGEGTGAAEALTLLEFAPRLTPGDVSVLRSLTDQARAPLLRAAIPLAIAVAGTREGGVELAQAYRLVDRQRQASEPLAQACAQTAAQALGVLLEQSNAPPSEAAVLLVRQLLGGVGARRALVGNGRYRHALRLALDASPTPRLHLARAADALEAGRIPEAQAAVEAALTLAPNDVDARALQRQLKLRRSPVLKVRPLGLLPEVDPGRARRAEERVAFTQRYGLVALPAAHGGIRVVAHFRSAARSPRWEEALDAFGYRARTANLLSAGGALTLHTQFAFAHWDTVRVVGRGDKGCSMRLRLHAGDQLGDVAGITYVVRQRWGETQLLSDGNSGRRVWRGHARGNSFKTSTSVALHRPGVVGYLDGVPLGARPRVARRRRTAGQLALEFRWGGGEVERLELEGRWSRRTRRAPPPPSATDLRARVAALRPLPNATALKNQNQQRPARLSTLGELRKGGWGAQAQGLWRARRTDGRQLRLPLSQGDCEVRAQVLFRPKGWESQAGVALYTEDGDAVWLGPLEHEGSLVVALIVQRNWELAFPVRAQALASDATVRVRLQRIGDFIVASYALDDKEPVALLERPLYFPLDSDVGMALFGMTPNPPQGLPMRFHDVEVKVAQEP